MKLPYPCIDDGRQWDLGVEVERRVTGAVQNELEAKTALTVAISRIDTETEKRARDLG